MASIILAPLLGVLGGSPEAALAAYRGNCAAYSLSQTAAVRGVGHGFTANDITGVIGDAWVRALGPCLNPTGSEWDEPAVLPANLQSLSNDSGIVQIGYLKCGRPSPQTCGNIPNDGNMHFTYICDDVSGGAPCLADGWATTPVIGRRYRFRVQYNQLGTGKWDYSIQDLTTGTTYTHSVTSHWHDGNVAWYGAESHDHGSNLGPNHISGMGINMYWMQYLRTSVGSWRVVTDLVQGDDFGEFGDPYPTWYTESVHDQNYTNDAAVIWTEDH
jgi:hypothetical protein